MIHGMSKVMALLLIGCVLVGVVAGCAKQPVTQDKYDQIKTGMTLKEVEGILGKGDETAAATGEIGETKVGGSTYVWEDGDKTITVVFDKDNRMVRKSQIGLSQ